MKTHSIVFHMLCETVLVHKKGRVTSKLKCIILIQNVYILKQEVTGITKIGSWNNIRRA